MERKHRATKRSAVLYPNWHGLDKGLLEELTVRHLRALERPFSMDNIMENPRSLPKRQVKILRSVLDLPCQDQDILTCRMVYSHGRAVVMGDVTVYDLHGRRCVCEVLFFVAVGDRGEPFAVVREWTQAALRTCLVQKCPPPDN